MSTAISANDDLLANVDHHSAYFREHNYEIYEQLRERCPVAHSNAWGGFWMLVDYDDVYAAEQDTETFSCAPAKQIPSAGTPDPFIPIDIDPPLLQEYRRITLSHLSPTAAKRSEGYFRRLATELIDEFIETGSTDIVGRLTTPLPAIWILDLLGFDRSRWAEWVDWIHSVVHDRSAEPEKAAEGVTNIYANIMGEMQRRRAEGFGDDLLSVIMQARVNGEPMSDPQIIGYAFMMLLGGMDTTSGLTGNALIQLDRHRDLRERLIREPEILPKATEEFLRHSTPVQGQYRLITRDCEFGGQHLRKGDRAMLMMAAANRDPKIFPDPDRLDFDRMPNRHMAFGVGPHRCLGSNFARVMFGVMISEVLRRLPDYTISGEIEMFPDAGDVYAPRRLPIRFTPGPRLATG